MISFADFAKKMKLLTTSQKQVLKVMTIYYQPLSQTDLVTLLRACEVFKDNGKRFIPSDIRGLRKELVDEGWLTTDVMSRMVCHADFEEYLMRTAILDENFTFWVGVIRKLKPWKVYYTPINYDATVRELRIAIYSSDDLTFEEALRFLRGVYETKWNEFDFVNKVFLPFDARWFATYQPKVQAFALQYLIYGKIAQLKPTEEIQAYLESSELLRLRTNEGASIREKLAQIYVAKGMVKDLEALLLLESNPLNYNQYQGILEFFKGQYTDCLLYTSPSPRDLSTSRMPSSA